MKFLIIASVFLNLNTVLASVFSTGETIGGPFRGKCHISSDTLPEAEFHFDIKPNTKIGARLDNGRQQNAVFVQVINNSFDNKLSVAIVNSYRIITNPPRFCMNIGPYNQCDYMKSEAAIPSTPAKSDEIFSFETLVGTLNFEKHPTYRGYVSEVSDAWTEVIAETNQAIEDKVQLKIDDQRILVCKMEYLNLF